MIWWSRRRTRSSKRGYRRDPPAAPKGTSPSPRRQTLTSTPGAASSLKFKNGTQIEFYSAERPEGMLGEGVDYAVLDEAAIMPPNIWEQVVRPTLMDREGGLLISTPRGRGRTSTRRSSAARIPRIPSGLLAVPVGPTSTRRGRDRGGKISGRPVRAGGRGEVHRRGLLIFIIPAPDHPARWRSRSGHVVLGITTSPRPSTTRCLRGARRPPTEPRVERFRDVTQPAPASSRSANDPYRQGSLGITLMVDGTRRRRPDGGRAGGTGLRRHRPQLHHVQGQRWFGCWL